MPGSSAWSMTALQCRYRTLSVTATIGMSDDSIPLSLCRNIPTVSAVMQVVLPTVNTSLVMASTAPDTFSLFLPAVFKQTLFSDHTLHTKDERVEGPVTHTVPVTTAKSGYTFTTQSAITHLHIQYGASFTDYF